MGKGRLVPVWAVLLGLGACYGPGNSLQPSSQVDIPEDVTAPWSAVSPGGRGWAYTELRRSEAFMVVNGRRLGPYP